MKKVGTDPLRHGWDIQSDDGEVDTISLDRGYGYLGTVREEGVSLIYREYELSIFGDKAIHVSFSVSKTNGIEWVFTPPDMNTVSGNAEDFQAFAEMLYFRVYGKERGAK